MVIAFLRGKNGVLSTSSQQDFIIDYANQQQISIEITEIDDSMNSKELEKRTTLLNLLDSLKADDTLLVYDLWSFSQKVGELAKVFDCILRHNINVHLCKKELIINNDMPSGVLINILSQQREKNLLEKNSIIGRPKGSFSKSKFDKYKSQIVSMIQEELSVSEIAKRLEVSRSSLKDYINSRSLKEIALSKIKEREENKDIKQVIKLPDPNECPLTDKKL
jgi:DNA invertase Pin-like site-specific DNA recombinase